MEILFVQFITPVTHWKMRFFKISLFNQIRLSFKALRKITIDRADFLQGTLYSHVGLAFGQFALFVEMRRRFSFTLF